MSLTVTGLKEFNDKISRLPEAIKKEGLEISLRPAAILVRDSAKAKCPKDTGELAASINIAPSRTSKDKFTIPVRAGEGFYKGETFFGGFVEFGHAQGSRKLGDSRRWIAPKPFMRPAADEQRGPAAVVFAEKMGVFVAGVMA